jgi:hypothetical protein
MECILQEVWASACQICKHSKLQASSSCRSAVRTYVFPSQQPRVGLCAARSPRLGRCWPDRFRVASSRSAVSQRYSSQATTTDLAEY